MTNGCNSQGSETVVDFCTFILWSISAGYNPAQAALRVPETHINQQNSINQSTCLFVNTGVHRNTCIYCLLKCVKTIEIPWGYTLTALQPCPNWVPLSFKVAVGLNRLGLNDKLVLGTLGNEIFRLEYHTVTWDSMRFYCRAAWHFRFYAR